MKKITLIIITTVCFCIPLSAQNEAYGSPDIFVLPQFLIAIIAGILLALGFQIVLTAISLATGITAVGDVRETYIKNKHHFNGKDTIFDDGDDSDDTSNTGVVVSSAFGAWSLITVSISLFAATLLATKLTLVTSIPMVITLSLVIWSAFLMILFYFESKVASTLLGGLVGLATSGLKASGNTIKNMFTPSDETKVQHVLDSSIKKIRSEFSDFIDIDQFKNTLANVGKEVEQKIPDYESLKKDLKEILKDSGNDNSGSGGSSLMVLQQLVNKLGNSSDESEEGKSKQEQLKNLVSELKDEYNKADSNEDKARNVVQKLSPADEEVTNKYFDKVLNYFANTDANDVNSSSFQKVIDEVSDNPTQIMSILGKKLNDIDRESVVEILNKNTSFNKEDIENNISKVEKLIDSMKTQLNEFSMADLSKKIEKPIAQFFNGTNKPELNYSSLKYDLKRAINNPGDSIDIVKSRINQFDSDTFISLITANTGMESSDIDHLKEQVESTKNELRDQFVKIEEKAKLTIENAKRKAVIEAEHLRKVAASAAWWLVATAVFSGVAAVAGAIVSINVI